MKIIVLANEDQQKEILLKQTGKETVIFFTENFSEILNEDADAYFILKEDVNINQLNQFTAKPLFLNSVISTAKQLQLSKNIFRINGWPTFLQRDIWEIAGKEDKTIIEIFNALQWKYILVEDEPGFISARIISMIINEAFFALGDNVSTKQQIDVAMKLGTNYPFGPFEWSEKIGLKNIYSLLKKLCENDIRYTIAPSLKQEITFTYKS